ncbi:acetyl-CoA carboxylase, biotin carboxyl carrier protein, partial [Deinococcus sp. 6GRE01]|nr:acetyl-CoA carboxylase, biotin carboxyl carrier protein [Deinococcus sp. 6GRE01]
MNPNDLKQILDALTYADVREFSLRTGSFDLSLKRGPQA